ncbi:MAG: S8 family serine peptidase [Candidatus Thermoplasmatota archaeon]|nr:S8 family serine peptidase [Candidatus Thermoplasmatota archaeon]MBU1940167.1 S8 family serine peptidase [Candidatus Thermoplasmatota archaeon]
MDRRLLAGIIILIIIISILGSITALPYFITPTNSWVFQQTQINKLHDLGYDGSDITIGIIDTGVDIHQPEFDTSTFNGWNDLINHEPMYYDDADHGTHLAGILTAQGSYEGLFSNILLKGIAPKSTLIIVKAIPENQYLFGGGTYRTIADGITYCMEHHADIILLGLGANPEQLQITNTTHLIQTITNATSQGIFIVVPAGNDGQHDDGEVIFPASLETVITVGATTQLQTIAPFSSQGHQYPTTHNPHKKPEILAPGHMILSTRINSAYGYQSGTAQAAAIVTGILALLLDAYPQYQHTSYTNHSSDTIPLFKEALATTAKKIGSLQHAKEPLAHDDSYGYGLIQAYVMYEYLAQH